MEVVEVVEVTEKECGGGFTGLFKGGINQRAIIMGGGAGGGSNDPAVGGNGGGLEGSRGSNGG